MFIDSKMKHRHISLLAALAVSLSTFAAPAGRTSEPERNLGQTIHSLRLELQRDYQKRVAVEGNFENQYRNQRFEMVSIMKKCNELALILYSQKQDFTFDLTYALNSVTAEYNDFKDKRLPYDRIASRLEWDIDRYARLLESLRRLPPELEEINTIPDSLVYRNDTLNFRRNHARPAGFRPGRQIPDSIAVRMRPYILDETEQADRDSCIYYASELLKMCAKRKDRVVADSTHYQRTYLRLKESYDYAQARYKVLQERIFIQGQTPYTRIIPHFGAHWKRSFQECREKYASDRATGMHSSDNAPLMSILWLFVSILAALLIRLRKDHLKNGLLLYLPLLICAVAVFSLRMAFLPNSMMNLIFPPLLLVFLVWQTAACLRHGAKTQGIDRIICWGSVAILLTGFIVSVLGYIYFGLLIMIWWFFQITFILAIITIVHLLDLFKDKILTPRIKEYKKSLFFLPASERDSHLFGATWLYDLVVMTVLPVLAIVSIPLCIKMSLDVFDFSDLYQTIVYKPFVNLTNAEGASILRISFQNILVAGGLYFVFRYLNYSFYNIYKSLRYAAYMHKNGRKTVPKNEINLSLGKSIIGAIVWFVYIIIVIVMLKIPTTSLTIIAGGLSAGIGIAMKDIINNFIYGIQLMSGRVRVGDWIECDGVRGRVTDISYQSTQIETVEGAVMSFLNEALFNKNFRNLTHNNSYEFVKITVGVSYGTDITKVRDTLVDAMQELRTKDSYGREIVDPKKGIYVSFDAFDESSVNIAVKQYVLVAERIAYVDKAKEVIYDALNAAGISIPFPQRDIHIVSGE